MSRWAAQRHQYLGNSVDIAGGCFAAHRDTRPLLQGQRKAGKSAISLQCIRPLWRIVAMLPVAHPLYSMLQTQLARSLLKAARVYTTTG